MWPIPTGRAIRSKSNISNSAKTTFIASRVPPHRSGWRLLAQGIGRSEKIARKMATPNDDGTWTRGLGKHLADMDPPRESTPIFAALWAAFVVQIAGRLLDLQWHRTHTEFETGKDQIQAHWLVWLGTLLMLIVAAWALRTGPTPSERRGYLTVVIANALYGGVGVVHFIQHLNHQEVDWAHISLAVTNVAAAVGVLMVTATRMSARRSLGAGASS